MAAIGCGVTKFYELVNASVLDVRRFGRRTLVTAESLEAFVASLPRAMTPTMKAELEVLGERAEPHTPEAARFDNGGKRQSPRSRSTFTPPRNEAD
jgi:hypothetical protein